MKMRAPAYPLATVDPYLNLWSMTDRLTDEMPKHWTGRDHSLAGLAEIDGKTFCFMGDAKRLGLPPMEQVGLEWDAFHTVYQFQAAGVRLTADFFTPLLMEDLELLSRPVSYLRVTVSQLDGGEHQVVVTLRASEELCVDDNRAADMGIGLVHREPVPMEGLAAMRMGSLEQRVLGKSGDNVRIDWGYLYLCADGESASFAEEWERMACISTRTVLHTGGTTAMLAVLAYDDVDALLYFGQHVPAYWKRNGKTIEQAVREGYAQYEELNARCAAFAKTLRKDAVEAGGEEYAQLLELSYRQVLAAHKLAVDPEGKLLYVSKECFSGGFAATADVSYPSIPLFLLYRPELVEGMMRPILRYAGSPRWPYEFAPHDAGRYPILNGQLYSRGTDPRWQMPVEECGNMLLMAVTSAVVQDDFTFFREHGALLERWAGYLLQNGYDPENQLCTDDFAGHLAHNCNLSLKAIVSLGAYGKVLEKLGRPDAARYGEAARRFAARWVEDAANGDGSYRLAFDRPGTFSMKYNLVWDRLLGLGLFPQEVYRTERESYDRHQNAYGLPLDNRADYTKSDWQIWSACLYGSREDFARMIHPVWLTYHCSPSRVPMNDWYSTITSKQVKFQNRTVQGGLYLKLLMDKELCRIR